MLLNEIIGFYDKCCDGILATIPDLGNAVQLRSHPIPIVQNQIYDLPSLTQHFLNHPWQHVDYNINIRFTNSNQEVSTSAGRAMAMGLVFAFDEIIGMGGSNAVQSTDGRRVAAEIEAWCNDGQNQAFAWQARLDLNAMFTQIINRTPLDQLNLPALGNNPGEEAVDNFNIKWLLAYGVSKAELHINPSAVQARLVLDQLIKNLPPLVVNNPMVHTPQTLLFSQLLSQMPLSAQVQVVQAQPVLINQLPTVSQQQTVYAQLKPEQRTQALVSNLKKRF